MTTLPAPAYARDGITLYHGDTNLILGELPTASVDAVVTDPPYSSGGLFRGDRARSTREKYVDSDVARRTKIPEFGGDSRDQRSYEFWSVYWLTLAFAAAKDSAPIAVFTDWRQLSSTADAMQAAGWVWRGILVWDKGGGARPQVGRPSAQCEYVLWGSKGAWPGNPAAGAIPGVVQHPPLYEGRDDKRHIAQKPIPVMQHILRVVTPGGTVLDPFFGSGSTLVAAKQLGLGGVGIEADRHSVDTAIDRLQQVSLPIPAAHAVSLPLGGVA